MVVPNKAKVTSATSSRCGGLDFQNHPPEYTVEFCNCKQKETPKNGLGFLEAPGCDTQNRRVLHIC